MTNAVNIAQGGSNNVTFRNKIINGAMAIDQRSNGSAVTINGTSAYGLDRWNLGWITSGIYTGQQVADAPTGFTYSNKITITTTTTAADLGNVVQKIEANNCFDLNWGTSTGLTTTLSFWAKANNTGTYCGYIQFTGASATYYYVFPYTINSASTWQYITVAVPPAPVATGAFNGASNTQYMIIAPLVIGSSGQSGTATANTWSATAGNYKTSGSFNMGSTSGATFQFTGVQFEVGTAASPFENRLFTDEYNFCQRYFFVPVNVPVFGTGPSGYSNWIATPYQTTNPSVVGVLIIAPVSMRTTPAITIVDPNTAFGLNWAGPGGWSGASSWSVNASNISLNTFRINFSGNNSSSTIAVGAMSNLQIGTGCQMFLSAEL